MWYSPGAEKLQEGMAMEFLSLGKVVICCFLLWGILVTGQPSTEGYISIDCGISSGYSYNDPNTKLEYISDDQFIDTGINYNIAGNYNTSDVIMQNRNLRSFPDGDRNCYTLKPVIPGRKYLLRARFMYGNYDGNNSAKDDSPILFDLHIGVNFWKKVNISDASGQYRYEAITVAVAEFIQVCLINTSTGTPFVSSLEMRPLKSSLYPAANASQSIALVFRNNLASTSTTPLISISRELGHVDTPLVHSAFCLLLCFLFSFFFWFVTRRPNRYPDDPYDRIWTPWDFVPYWSVISTASTFQNYADDPFEPPSVVYQTAAVPVNDTSLGFYWEPGNGPIAPQYFVVLYMGEVQQLTGSAKRVFDIYLNGNIWHKSFEPPYLMMGGLYSTSPLDVSAWYNFSLNATTNSTLPPLLNALEAYSLMLLPELMTDLDDVEAIMGIKEDYQMKRNWVGDPCAPKKYAWDGMTCSYSASAPRITALNLSSSGLTGYMSTSFSMLKEINSLDLSYNKLNGTIPDFLANLSSLQFLDLTANCFTEPIPDVLLKRSAAGSLKLRTDNSTNKCDNGFSTETSTKKLTTPIIVTISVVPVVLLALAVVGYMLISKRRQQGLVSHAVRPQAEEVPLRKIGLEELETKVFTYLQLENITNKFTRVIGQGGFGTVYLGYLEGSTEVAVKLLSGWSSQGMKEFLAETQNLRKVHHKNLVSLVGYCNDREHMALVYEYLPQGSLHDHLRGKAGLARPLSWRERLQIVLEAAQGLDYLHKGCKQSIIHRDVKPSNILLGHHLEAKIADFGLSKAMLSDAQYESTVALVGTPGYMDPEYHRTLQLSEKSDVYSFGVVLLEIVTGEPPIVQGTGKVHILERVKPKLNRGDIEEIMDRRLLRGKYDVNSVWKVLELAMMCTQEYSTQRPTMADVVVHLKESLTLETSCISGENPYSERPSIGENSAFGDISGTFSPSAR
ncbi:putative leucine-rich repeat receptor-like protein kinase At2g19210 [Typha latifolia]|uniref:putative leucine-rich repeat receptor-like protein kinase At2g19210 n=1 Tax=Typha latifolia TaxID=4733 RepID=UPI003C2E9CB8